MPSGDSILISSILVDSTLISSILVFISRLTELTFSDTFSKSCGLWRFRFWGIGIGAGTNTGSGANARGQRGPGPTPGPGTPGPGPTPGTAELDLSRSFAELTSSNAESYSVSGSCDFSLGRKVIVTLNPYHWNPEQVELDCQPDNTFSGTIDARNVPFSEATFVLTHGDLFLEVPVEIENKIVRRLTVDPLDNLTILNRETYSVSGSCGSLLGSEVRIRFLSTSIDEVTICDSATDTFSHQFDASSVPSSLSSIIVKVTHGGSFVDSSIENQVIPLEIYTADLLPLNMATAPAYSVTGSCDFNEGSTNLMVALLAPATSSLSYSVSLWGEMSSSHRGEISSSWGDRDIFFWGRNIFARSLSPRISISPLPLPLPPPTSSSPSAGDGRGGFPANHLPCG